MRPILIDTNAYSAFMRGDDGIAQVLARADKLYLNSVVMGELLGGFRMGIREAWNRKLLSQFLESPRMGVLPITDNTADYYALVHAELRRKGKPIPSNDLWIAASAIEHGAALLTLDTHFSHIENLKTGQCIEDFLP
jgi:predicted nucleic acid-binding protein